jgi:hypothetical protein
LQIGDLKGLFGLLMVTMQILRLKSEVLDNSYGIGTGKLGFFWLAMKFGPEMPLYISNTLIKLSVRRNLLSAILFQAIQISFITMENF